MTAVHHNRAPVSSLGFFGPAPSSHLFVLSSLETLSIWDLANEGACLATHDKLRRETDMLEDEETSGGANTGGGGDGIDYLVGCQYDKSANRLYLLAGEHSGTLHLLAVEQAAVVALASLRGGAAGGHVSDVRCFHWGANSLLTGGEDARLCSWGAGAGDDAAALASSSRKAAGRADKPQRRATPY